MIEQEKNGYKDAYKKLHVSKMQLLNQHAVYCDLVKQGDGYFDEYLKLIDMIYWYVYYETFWYADMKNTFYVDISDFLIKQL